MQLAAGMKLGQYEIRSLLGAGGMGEVYRAFDANLKREVAVKILPEAFAEDTERVARFRREAQLLAALNHPNIAVIHDVQKDGGTLYLVLELIEGESLAERLMHGPLPVDEALEICKQIAEALEAAHGKGILHRDLKPGNAQITPEGRVKVLDFGLAKMTGPDAVPASAPNSPTILSPVVSPVHTRAEIILGTAAYMSPEQARGRTVDARADLWAFGCVLFEALTARRAFEGEDVTETIALIVKGEPDWSLLPPETPVVVRSLLRQCLQKQPKQRLGDARSARLALEDALAQPAAVVGAVGSPRTAPRMAWQPAAAAAGTAAVAVLVAWALWPTPARESAVEPERPVTRLLLDVAPANQLSSIGHPSWSASPAMAISSDGRTIVFAGAPRERANLSDLRIYRRRLDEAVATPMQGTEGGFAPFFSPDGQWVAFLSGSDAQLKKAPIDGGPAVPIARLGPNPGLLAGASWGTDNTILYSFARADGIFRVSADGGTPERVTSLDAQKEWRHTAPHMLPGGRAMLYTVGVADGDTLGVRVMAHRFDTGETQLLLDNAADARFLTSGHLLYMRSGTLMAATFDPESLETGPEIGMLDEVVQAIGATNANAETYHGQFDVAANGTLVYLSGGVYPPIRSELVWLDRTGAEEPVPNTPAGWGFHLRFAPDGTRFAMAVYRGGFFAQNDIWVYDIGRSTTTRLTYGGAPSTPVWSPDGNEIVHDKSFANRLFRVRADGGGGNGQRVSTRESDGTPVTWSRTDNVLLFLERSVGDGSRVWALPMDGNGEATLFKESQLNLGFFQFSPDGRWLAYTANGTGTQEVYVEPYPGPGDVERISPDGGHSPAWAGNELFYLRVVNERAYMMAVDIDTTAGFRAGAPRELFELPFSIFQATLTGPVRSYDVTADGRRFIMSKLVSTLPDPITHMHVVLNWAEELKRRVPVAAQPAVAPARTDK